LLQLQLLAGNAAVTRLLAERASGRREIAVQRAPSTADRKRRTTATALHAADARSLLQAALPFALARMTGEQIGQVQRVLDAAVVNPEVQKKVDDLERRSITAQSGSLTIRDPAMTHRADRAREDFVPISESDKRVRLDYKALLTPDALTQRTDNPDETAYLAKVRNSLAGKGVWLRYEPKLVRDPEDPSRRIIDPRQFEAWLSLGPSGDHIPTATGELTRDALIGTTVIGAGYYEHVDQGPAQRALDQQIKRLTNTIESGLDQHNMLAGIRRRAAPGVAEASDLFGGADFPDRSIWDDPHKFVLRAMEMNVGGNLTGSQAFLVTAAILTRNAAKLLADYLEDSSTGVGRVVTVLKIAKTAGQVAEVGLAVTGVVGLARGAVSLGTGAGTSALASDVDVAAEQLAKRYAAENGIHADELAKVRYVPGPKGSVGGGVKPGTSSGAGTGWHEW
jgi:hypothetical protein